MHILRSLQALIFCGIMVLASGANAGPTCTNEPSSEWLSEAEMKAKISSSGYAIDVFKTTKGNCYEIYGRTETGKRVEVYYHPITGAVVKETVR
ncbi:MAG: PepSY domain-containing protein [Geminicoccaceae bacterium]